MLMSIKWYFEIKNLSLKKLLIIYAPLSIDQHNDLRLYYSQYFSALVSATELLRDKNFNLNYEAFDKRLKDEFFFDNFINGEVNYGYIRELRNSIVHRGIDITSSAHFGTDNRPLIIAPIVENQGGTKKYLPFEYYLINVIVKCEMLIPKIILNHLHEFNMFGMTEFQEDSVAQTLKYVNDSIAVPYWAKKMAKEAMKSIDIDFIAIHKHQIQNCIDVLKVDILNVQK